MAGGASMGGEDEGITGINVTPFVDICLVLLIIFMVTAKYITSQSIPVDLPEAASASDTQQVAVANVSIGSNGQMYVDLEPVDDALLRARMQQRLAQSLCCVHRSAHELGIEPQRTQICELVHQGTHGAFGSAQNGPAQIPPIRGLLVGTHRSRPLQSALLVQIAPHRQSPWLTHSCACPCGQPAPGPHALVQVAISASAVTKSQRNPLVRSPCGRSITEVRAMYAAVHLRSNADNARTVQAPSSCARSRPIVIGVPRFGPPRLLV